MKLNEKEKTELAKALRKQYDEAKSWLDNPETNWVKTDKDLEMFNDYLNDLKEKYEILEQEEEPDIELALDKFGCKKDNFWWGILGLAVVASFCDSFSSFVESDNENDENPETNTDLN